MKRLLMLLLLCFFHACAESPPVMLLPQGHTCLASVPVGAEEEYRLMALANQEENAVKLAIAVREDDGVYRVEALSGMILSLDGWDADAVWMQDKWQDRHPYFWWGAGGERKTSEFYLQFEYTADLGWVVASGYMTDNITGLTYHFICDTPGLVQVSGEPISPAIVWPTGLSMQLEDFVLYEVDQACGPSLHYLETFALTHMVDEQDETYRIIW